MTTKRRSRVCAGGSANTIVLPKPIMSDAITQATPRTSSLAYLLSAENRGSEYTVSASAKRVTNHAGTP